MSNNDAYQSDYPEVIYTSEKYKAINVAPDVKTNTGGLFAKISELLNSDMFKQIMPLLLGGKTNMMSLIQNINPNIASVIKSLNINPSKGKTECVDNIIDMSEYKIVD